MCLHIPFMCQIKQYLFYLLFNCKSGAEFHKNAGLRFYWDIFNYCHN